MKWDVISLPVIATEVARYDIATPLGVRRVHRREGDILQPALMSRTAIEDIRNGMTEFNFGAQYQQQPVAREGNIIKRSWLKTYYPDQEPKPARIYQSWDTGNKTGEENAYSVCTTWGVSGRRFYLLDVFRQRVLYPELKDAIQAQRELWRPGIIIVEDKASGTQILQDFRGKLPLRAYEPIATADKAMRLELQSPHIRNGFVFLPEKASWLTEYVAELTSAPSVRFWDQVDSTSQFLDFITQPGSMPLVITPQAAAAISKPSRTMPCLF